VFYDFAALSDIFGLQLCWWCGHGYGLDVCRSSCFGGFVGLKKIGWLVFCEFEGGVLTFSEYSLIQNAVLAAFLLGAAWYVFK